MSTSNGLPASASSNTVFPASNPLTGAQQATSHLDTKLSSSPSQGLGVVSPEPLTVDEDEPEDEDHRVPNGLTGARSQSQDREPVAENDAGATHGAHESKGKARAELQDLDTDVSAASAIGNASPDSQGDDGSSSRLSRAGTGGGATGGGSESRGTSLSGMGSHHLIEEEEEDGEAVGSDDGSERAQAAEDDDEPPQPAKETEKPPPPQPAPAASPPAALVTPTTKRVLSGHGRSQSMAVSSTPPFAFSSSAAAGAAATAGGSNSATPRASPRTPRVRPPSVIETSSSSRAPAAGEQDPAVPPKEQLENGRARSAATGESNGKDKEKEGSSSSTARTRRTLGEWSLGKTLGAGSMGKVKLGTSTITGEKVAVKIIPRFTSTTSAQRATAQAKEQQAAAKEKEGTAEEVLKDAAESGKDKKKDDKPKVPPTASFLAKAAAKDASKEVRTMREGSLCLLLHHPYICGMKSMIVYPHHYYMVSEYVDGGQMLDYIISHGRLRERSARKFARQIGSALEYCHANSIVHRDLKIENILISKTGNIKIIDFGLSNLFSPTSHLTTFCGSLYFAAPELLNAKPYLGPEVDVWSFGIVVYVLVCGKVPFDDQSMPALHAKIKKGNVEYPPWLSAECKSLLSRMLVTNPAQRATLQEVLSHPWMLKGFNGAPTSHLPSRTPLRAEDLDREIIKGMVGFEFGTDEHIYDKLVDVLTSDLYYQTVRTWEQRHLHGESNGGGLDGQRGSTDRPATRTDGKDMKRDTIGRSPNKRFSGFGFYGKKLATGINAAFSGGNPKSSDEALDAQLQASLGGGRLPEVLDPTRGFHPLISIYFLVKEKIEREKIYGPGVFASSTLSLTGPPPPPAPAMAYGSPTPTSPAFPQSAAGMDSVVPPSPVVASPRMPMTPQPRQRAEGMDHTKLGTSTAPPLNRADEQANKRMSFQAPSPTSTLRPRPNFDSSTPPSNRRSIHIMPSSAERERAELSGEETSGGDGGSTFVRRFGSLLGRSSTQSDTEGKRHRSRPSVSSTAHKSGTKTTATALPQVEEHSIRSPGSDVPIPAPVDGKAVQRASTVGGDLSPSSRHSRKASGVFASTLGRATGSPSADRRRQVSDHFGAGSGGGGAGSSLRPPGANDDDADGDHASLAPTEAGLFSRTPSRGAESAKPVYLKGLFSVATTSTKPISTLRSDLVNVLDRIGIQHREVKNGFECVHSPSIDLSSLAGASGGEKAKPTIRRRASKLLLSSSTSKDRNGGGSQASLHEKENVAAGARDRTTTSSTSFTVLSAPDEPAVPSAPNTGRDDRSTNRLDLNAASGPSSDMVVRFEVFLVKMPLLPGIHGLQFRRIGGNAWQYQMLARRVLHEMKL